MRGHTAVVNLLVEHCAILTCRDRSGRTATDWAVRKGHKDTVTALGADFDALAGAVKSAEGLVQRRGSWSRQKEEAKRRSSQDTSNMWLLDEDGMTMSELDSNRTVRCLWSYCIVAGQADMSDMLVVDRSHIKLMLGLTGGYVPELGN